MVDKLVSSPPRQPQAKGDQLTPQEVAFNSIMDVKSQTLTVPLGVKSGRAALQKLNEATVRTFQLLSEAETFSLGTTLSQGACLLVAVFHLLGLLESAWSGPPADLAEFAVKVPLQLTGGTKKTVW